MAVTLEIFVERVNGLELYLKKAAREILFKHEKKIIDMSNAQLMEGKNVKDKVMQEGYSKQYGKRRQKKGLQTKFVDLRFSGKYQDTKVLVSATGNDAFFNKGIGFNIKSDVDYEQYLRKNYKNHIGLNKANAEIISEDIVDGIAQLTKKYLIA